MAQPFSAGKVRSRDPCRTSQRSLEVATCKAPYLQHVATTTYSSRDLLRLHDHVIARARCEQRACCDHSFMRPREPAAAKQSAICEPRPRTPTCRSTSKSESVG
ncbi:UNVERIFIED_CONTAM: hypothetical protein Slati_0902300 [Sesamum latifolium]|uniref:Uncharacterized protein n=1 Tax=Sesamum latifolium TaxID=2727402 RepID=A0AAW2XPI0_9LAMI